MGYRSLKRVLTGDTNLERKCRVLFLLCLLLLIFGAFYWVHDSARRLIIDTTRRKGNDMVMMSLMRHHFEWWHVGAAPPEVLDRIAGALGEASWESLTPTEQAIVGILADSGLLQQRGASQEHHEPLLHEVLKSFAPREYRYEFLGLEGDQAFQYLSQYRVPADAWEQDVLVRLREELLERRAERRAATDAGAAPEAAMDEAPTSALTAFARLDTDEPLIFDDRIVPEHDEYYYYEVVTWHRSCFSCHVRMLQDVGAVSAAESLSRGVDESPFLVVKVVMPWKEAKDAIHRARAGLIAVGIMTIFVAMVALYVIVRYVIVKPLRHLRDVSDEISRGHTDLRAELDTNDEFEELADSFNRMLRHLTEAQRELRQVNADLDAKVDQLAQLNMRLYEMNRLKGDFLANMSHELRTPLNSIIGFSEVLQGLDALNDKQKRYAQNIQKSGRLLLEMINDILDLAKMEAGKMDVRPTEFPIGALITAQCELVHSLTEDKNIDLDCRLEPKLPPVFQDQSKVQQILTNLLSNAIKFTPEGGRITVSVTRDEPRERLVMSVEDTGVGIPEEDREIIFEKFRQSNVVLGRDGLTREYSGTGLGLSIVRELCRLLGGEIMVESEVGRGSCFSVVLPWRLDQRARRSPHLAPHDRAEASAH